MAHEEKVSAAAGCPFCALWAAMKKSEAGDHLKGIERETLMLVRSLVTSCLRTTERVAARAAEKTSSGRQA